MAQSNITDGSYIILSVANTNFALDSAAAQDRDGTNVQIWGATGNDSQIVRVWTSPKGQQLCFAATGKVLDVDSAKMVSGTNVQQWSRNFTDAQQWTIEPVSGASDVTYHGASYTPMKIYIKAAKDLILEIADHYPDNMVNGKNVVISTDEVTAPDQEWIFVPVQSVPDGFYVIRPAVDSTLAIGIAGGSEGTGAQAQIQGRNSYANSQVFLFDTDATSGQTSIAAAHSGKLLEARTPLQNGQPVYQSAVSMSTLQRWVCVPSGAMDYNSAVGPCYELHSAAAEGTNMLVMDVCGASTVIGTQLQTFVRNGSRAQAFYLEPAGVYDAYMAAPTVDGIRAHGTAGSPTTGGFAGNTTQWDVVWRGTGTRWQIRYRTRYRKPAASSLGEWTAWMNASDDSTSNTGWGTVNAPTTTTPSGEYIHAYGPIILPALDNVTADLVEIQVEVRQHATRTHTAPGSMKSITTGDYGTSGATNAILSYRPTLTITGVTWTPEGMKVAYSTTSDSPAASITLSSMTTDSGNEMLAHAYTVSLSEAANGTINVPTSALTTIPDDGTAISMTASIATEAGTAMIGTWNTTLTWASSHGITVTPTYEITDQDSILTTIDKHDTDEVWLITPSGMQACSQTAETGTKRTFEIFAPLNVKYTVFYISKAADGTWGSSYKSDEISDKACVWTWTTSEGVEKAAILRYGEGKPMNVDNSIKSPNDSFTTSARPYPIYSFQVSVERTLDVSGVIDDIQTEKYSTSDDFEALLHQHHALFRTPYGTRYDVAVSDVSLKRSWMLTEVSVSQTAETV